MKSPYRPTCAKRSIRPPQDITTWAADLIARPQRYGADQRTREIVRDILAEAMGR